MREFPSRIFLNYRREDTLQYAERLYQSLAALFGDANVFRDVASLQPGENFPAAIERAIASSDVMLALIGRKWLTLSNKDGRRRISAKEDYVRLEIETALANEVEIIPLLVDGAEMPNAQELPKSIATVTKLNAYRLSWHEEMARLRGRIETISKRRAEEKATEQARNARIDLARHTSFSNSKRLGNVIINLMELSLQRKGFRVDLDEKDLNQQALATTGRTLDEGTTFTEMVYVIDHVGIAARGGKSQRYCARSIPLTSVREVPDQLKLNHPILAGVIVQDFWFSESVSKKGIIDFRKVPGTIQGGTYIGIVGHDPSTSMFRFLSAWPTWGERGFGWMTERAAAAYIDREMRAISAAPMVEIPFHIAAKREREASPRRRKPRKRKK
jgi:hypothetical protein